MADDIFNFFASRFGSGDIWVVIEFPEVFHGNIQSVHTISGAVSPGDPEDQDDSEQVEADEAAAAKCLGLSPSWLKIELDATSGRRSRKKMKLHFKLHNMNIMNLKLQ